MTVELEALDHVGLVVSDMARSLRLRAGAGVSARAAGAR
jgi:hypothetical protein